MLQRTASASAAMVSGYRQREAVGACTESLGSESGDVGGDIEQLPAVVGAGANEDGHGAGMVEHQDLAAKRRRGDRLLPPVMPRPAEAFMRAERRGGRLILTQVVRPVERPREVFCASRADGRLRLRFAEEDRLYGEERQAPESAETESGALVGGCGNGVGLRQAATGTGRRVEIGAVMGI
ncbi:protein SUGARY ENHANCER 1 [Aegilops tauschii subsp. strangulata]|uniref:FAF domain-containing protein n=3 Tax=Triticinae TaxID=1648030 RepID=A0A453HX42_AEGTS|nr:uncharacterized protein LOC109748179 [Aegilops tauschii subsp. strangulata]